MTKSVKRLATLVRSLRPHANSNMGDAISNIVQLDRSGSAFLRALAVLVEATEEAELELENEPRLDAEDKVALLDGIKRTRNALLPQSMNTQVEALFQNALSATASQFSLVASLIGDASVETASSVPELHDILNEILSVREAIKESELDSRTKRIVGDNVAAFEMFLRHIDLFGFDAAYAAYMDMFTRLRREHAKGAASAKVIAGFWPQIRNWSSKLKDIDELINAGRRLLEHGKDVAGLLGFGGK